MSTHMYVTYAGAGLIPKCYIRLKIIQDVCGLANRSTNNDDIVFPRVQKLPVMTVPTTGLMIPMILLSRCQRYKSYFFITDEKVK
jgi:hypothetical protein